MARNRKRAKERRARRPPSADGRVAIAGNGREDPDAAPPALEHAAPDVELAEAQLALGRPELAGDQTPEEIEALIEEEEQEEELEGYSGDVPGVLGDRPHVERTDEEFEDEFDDEDEDEELDVGGGGRGGRGRRRTGGDGRGGDGDGELVPASAGAGGGTEVARALPGGRFVNFLRGSWRELQRVQWPDRRQVVQATGVVIGFVIFAGLFLGGADWVSQKLVSLILK